MKSLKVVVGAQYGSEAKGHVTAQILDHDHDMMHAFDGHARPQVNVRVAGPNAGHTAYTANGEKFALRSVPVGATRRYPVTCVIAPGSEIDLDVLIQEWEALTEAGWTHNKTLYVDPNATLLEQRHKGEEASRLLVEKIGSTGKGIGAARSDRILRSAKRLVDVHNVAVRLRKLPNVHFEPYRYSATDDVVIEGTQGYGLGLHGLHYPQCTSSDCRAIDFLAMAGISPWQAESFMVWAVARMFPIRVAGNSGPMWNETTWEELGLPEERTTVTNKVRRVGRWDMDLVRDAVLANGGGPYVKLALTMVDQAWPEFAGVRSWGEALDVMRIHSGGTYTEHELWQFMWRITSQTGAHVGMLTTGPDRGFTV